MRVTSESLDPAEKLDFPFILNEEVRPAATHVVIRPYVLKKFIFPGKKTGPFTALGTHTPQQADITLPPGTPLRVQNNPEFPQRVWISGRIIINTPDGTFEEPMARLIPLTDLHHFSPTLPLPTQVHPEAATISAQTRTAINTTRS